MLSRAGVARHRGVANGARWRPVAAVLQRSVRYLSRSTSIQGTLPYPVTARGLACWSFSNSPR
ncbi:MAG: hypothetical protein JWO05_1892 [Gemmatimonadetes bacterium]|nr:hypothetical protein [Gemmatimonadota bacterium]